MRYCVFTASVLAVLVLAGCSSSKATGTVPSDGFPAPDKEFVWNVSAQVLRDQGYTPDSAASSQCNWVLVTHWRRSLQPFSGQGYRERVKVAIHDVPCKLDYYFTETQVIRQCNDNVKNPSSPTCAEWGDEQRQPDKECLINSRIEMYFLPGAVSPQFRKKYGMEDKQPMGRIPVSRIQRKPPTSNAPPLPVGSTPSSQPSR